MAGGLVNGNPANEPDRKPVKHHSNFKPNMSHHYGALFGILNPSYAAQAVPGDGQFSVRCNSDIDTFSLKAPLMTPVRHKKSYFYVPRKAILPNNADLLTTNPLTGDDIVPELVNSVIPRYPLLGWLQAAVQAQLSPLQNFDGTTYGAGTYTSSQRIFAIMQLYELGETFLSTSSLLHMSGCSVYQWFHGDETTSLQREMTYDETMDYLFNWLRKYFKSFAATVVSPGALTTSSGGDQILNYNSVSYQVDLDMQTAGFDNTRRISLRQFLSMIRENHCGQVISWTLRDGYTSSDVSFVPHPDDATYQDIAAISFFIDYVAPSNYEALNPENWINIERLLAYQLACAQWFSNDAVDAVYTTDLWHQSQMGLARVGQSAWGATGKNSGAAYSTAAFNSVLRNMYTATGALAANKGYYGYILNGLQHEYDSASGFTLVDQLLAYFYVMGSQPASYAYPSSISGLSDISAGWMPSTISDSVKNAYACIWFVKNVFVKQRSLRFKDYFVGSRTRPLAVGDVDVQTDASGRVSVVDITKNIMMQRFLNQVNRVHRTLKEYSRGIFGQSPMFDPREVMFVGSTEEIIGAEETENTAEAQQTNPQSITSHLRSNSSRFCFTFDVPEFGVIIGITSFEISRPYVTVTDREMYHVDRFDDFNPYMQHIGDQPIFGNELFNRFGNNFGYQLRYAEYKQRLDRASGPFAGSYLPGYALVATPETLIKPGATNSTLDSDFIRSRSYEFDQFYLALPNYSPAGYFHFIIRDDYEVSINRPMEAAPSIL